MASIQKTDKGYRAQIKLNGIRESQCFRTLREAKAWADARTYEITEAGKKPRREAITIAEVLKKYLAEVSPTKRGLGWERIRITAMLNDPNFESDKLLSELTPEMVARWRDSRLKEVKPGTVLREIGLLSSIMDTCIREWGLADQNPVKQIRKPKKPAHRDLLYTWRQIRAILKATGYRHKGNVRTVAQSVGMCFLVALRTGMRAGELTGLTWDRVYSDHVYLPVTKTTKRNVPLAAKSIRLIERMRGYDPLLVFGINPQSLDANFRKYRTRAGIDGMTFHDSRHYAATQMARKVDVLTLCKILGWTNPKQALVYYNPTVSDLARMLDGQ